jgi:hypothetical protein
MNSEPSPSTASPATPIPITDPPANDTSSALERLVRAACAVRTLALVAMRMPMKPALALNSAPTRKAPMMAGCDRSSDRLR